MITAYEAGIILKSHGIL